MTKLLALYQNRYRSIFVAITITSKFAYSWIRLSGRYSVDHWQTSLNSKVVKLTTVGKSPNYKNPHVEIYLKSNFECNLNCNALAKLEPLRDPIIFLQIEIWSALHSSSNKLGHDLRRSDLRQPKISYMVLPLWVEEWRKPNTIITHTSPWAVRVSTKNVRSYANDGYGRSFVITLEVKITWPPTIFGSSIGKPPRGPSGEPLL